MHGPNRPPRTQLHHQLLRVRAADLHVDAFIDERRPTAFEIGPMVLTALGAAALRVSVEIHPD
ncbi:hypothetical protein LF41_2704 [Lysobacter dokdonensis DS-58]|uniref:Uncharacterized protein n=1 Tax=Lysobacter dokdonensis DS-58 TaxID=1300345 RepID=A0A0A2X2I4_9GAMM|nr:hypothetical protein [Lysobacter dokdonensis]KGQ19449.1 hypothetical protein LF41_2704 [Lysobacter dokdonensis DS-58]